MAEKEYIEREAMVKESCERCIREYVSCDKEHCILMEVIYQIPAADVRPVVTCAECKWWTKQEASLQGRCELLQMYPTGAWFCANGKREES